MIRDLTLFLRIHIPPYFFKALQVNNLSESISMFELCCFWLRFDGFGGFAFKAVELPDP
jgi:hypothetical protein